MDDRELLELAAKAAGFSHYRYCDVHMALVPEPEGEDVLPFSVWSPLTNDGDALRLAVTCKIALNPMLVDGLNRDLHESAAGGVNRWTDCREKHNGDPFAATRRAIVRAAAEIGRAM